MFQKLEQAEVIQTSQNHPNRSVVKTRVANSRFGPRSKLVQKITCTDCVNSAELIEDQDGQKNGNTITTFQLSLLEIGLNSVPL